MLKMRCGFISNSSSCSFIISNKSNQERSLSEFVNENLHLIGRYNKLCMPKGRISQTSFLNSAVDNDFIFGPLESKRCVFNHLSTLVARVLDFTLRCDGESENFRWKFGGYIR
jgi:hypothetical protein